MKLRIIEWPPGCATVFMVVDNKGVRQQLFRSREEAEAYVASNQSSRSIFGWLDRYRGRTAA